MLEWLWERLTGRPYWSGRCASVEVGPPPGAVHAAALAQYSDAELVRMDRGDLLRLLQGRAPQKVAA